MQRYKIHRGKAIGNPEYNVMDVSALTLLWSRRTETVRSNSHIVRTNDCGH